jgi:hypothetical protein
MLKELAVLILNCLPAGTKKTHHYVYLQWRLQPASEACDNHNTTLKCKAGTEIATV